MEGPELSRRLNKVLSLCPRSKCIADIGTDHGLLPVRAVMCGKAKKAVACDLRKGPLDRCIANIEAYGAGANVSARLAYGLDGLEPGEADTVTIAGMGGMLICEIITKAIESGKLTPGTRLVLCPNTHDEYVRRMVCSRSFILRRECPVREDGMIYLIVSCVYTGENSPFSFVSDGLKEQEFFIPEHFTGVSGTLPKYYYRKVMLRASKRLKGLSGKAENYETALVREIIGKCESFLR
ncbi:MAG: SAM-dependent methyltransferase [Clostridia bacterium]|nr:SAM-dependent methyltransferase [Clostridia bacterium]